MMRRCFLWVAVLSSTLHACSLVVETDCSEQRSYCPEGYRCVNGGCEPPSWEYIEASAFVMGSPSDELGRFEDEVPHQVTLTYDFDILSREVTQAEFETLMGYDPSSFSGCDGGSDCPVDSVTWHEAAAYCNALATAEELPLCYDCAGSGRDVVCLLHQEYESPYFCQGYRLPTEAEWEYTARGGETTATPNGDLSMDLLECEQPNAVVDSIAWFCGNSGDAPHAVAIRDANNYSIHDMLGNLREWCHDWDDDYPEASVTDPWGPDEGERRVHRGGSWDDRARDSRLASRYAGDPDVGRDNIGFRPVRSRF